MVVIVIFDVFVHFVQVQFTHVLRHNGVVDKGEASEVLLDSGRERRCRMIGLVFEFLGRDVGEFLQVSAW